MMADAVKIGQLHVVASMVMKCCPSCWEFPQSELVL